MIKLSWPAVSCPAQLDASNSGPPRSCPSAASTHLMEDKLGGLGKML